MPRTPDQIRDRLHALDHAELLTLWRTWPCRDLQGAGDLPLRTLLTGLLRRALRAADPEAAAVVTQDAPSCAPLAAALRVKRTNDEPQQDIRMSWILVHALTGHATAVMSVVTIAEKLQMLGLRRLSLGWQRLARLDLSSAMSISGSPLGAARNLGKWRQTLVDAMALAKGKPVGQDDEAAEKKAAPKAAQPPLFDVPDEDAKPAQGRQWLMHAALVVCPEIGQGSEHAKIALAYKALTGPLPLAGQDVSPDALAAALDAEFPWLEEATAAVYDDLVLRRRAGTPWVRVRPTLLVGPPGVGKTRWARRLAQMVGCGFGEIAAAGSSDNRMLAGTARGWGSAQPALPLLVMHRTRTANPLIVVDEIEKAGASHNGSVHASLLAMLEPETARAWPDECLLAPCDLSQVTWICTANETRGIPSPLLSRLRIVRTGIPQPEHWPSLREGLLRDLAAELGVPADALPRLEPEAEAALRRAFETGASVRKVKAALERALARGAAEDDGPARH